jgi:hypothetical protein
MDYRALAGVLPGGPCRRLSRWQACHHVGRNKKNIDCDNIPRSAGSGVTFLDVMQERREKHYLRPSHREPELGAWSRQAGKRQGRRWGIEQIGAERCWQCGVERGGRGIFWSGLVSNLGVYSGMTPLLCS